MIPNGRLKFLERYERLKAKACQVEGEKTVQQYEVKNMMLPVLLTGQIKVFYIQKRWTAKIDPIKLNRILFKKVVEKESRLTGDEVKFVRFALNRSLRQFAKKLDVTHVSVQKWERSGKNTTTMSWNVEKNIRLFAKSVYEKNYQKFFEFYKKLESPFQNPKTEMICLSKYETAQVLVDAQDSVSYPASSQSIIPEPVTHTKLLRPAAARSS